MKPIIIYQSLNEKGKIELTKKEFEEYITTAYEQGRKDNAFYIGTSTDIKTRPGVNPSRSIYSGLNGTITISNDLEEEGK